MGCTRGSSIEEGANILDYSEGYVKIQGSLRGPSIDILTRTIQHDIPLSGLKTVLYSLPLIVVANRLNESIQIKNVVGFKSEFLDKLYDPSRLTRGVQPYQKYRRNNKRGRIV